MAVTIAAAPSPDVDDAASKTRAVLAAVGFGVVTQAGMSAAPKDRIDALR